MYVREVILSEEESFAFGRQEDCQEFYFGKKVKKAAFELGRFIRDSRIDSDLMFERLAEG